MKRWLGALVVAGVLVVGVEVSTASAQTVYNPPGYGPGNPVGVGGGVPTTGVNPRGYPAGYGPYGGYGYGARSYGYLGYYGGWYFGGDSGYTYPSYYGIDNPYDYAPDYYRSQLGARRRSSRPQTWQPRHHEPIADAALRTDVPRLPRVRLDLAAQVVDVQMHVLRRIGVRGPPHLRQDGLEGHDLARVLHQHAQQARLHALEIDALARDDHLLFGEVNLQPLVDAPQPHCRTPGRCAAARSRCAPLARQG